MTDPNYLPAILATQPWDDDRYAGCLWLCRPNRRNEFDNEFHRTLHCLITADGRTGLYEPVGGVGHKTTVRPHDRQHATLVLEEDAPEAIERLTIALAANGWKNVMMRP
jgi:hypothetical protein